MVYDFDLRRNGRSLDKDGQSIARAFNLVLRRGFAGGEGGEPFRCAGLPSATHPHKPFNKNGMLLLLKKFAEPELTAHGFCSSSSSRGQGCQGVSLVACQFGIDDSKRGGEKGPPWKPHPRASLSQRSGLA